MTRIVFMGSPEFAVPSLRALSHEHEIAGVVTQPDRPAGRGRELRPPAIKLEAGHLGVPVIQPGRLSEEWVALQLKEWAPELIVVAAFGQLLRRETLALPTQGCLNVHASLLPRWRGAAPIQASIAAGDTETGITIMTMDEGLDTGGILAQRSIRIASEDTGGTLAEKLAVLGAEFLVDVIPDYLEGRIMPAPQDASKATMAPSLKKKDGLLDASVPATILERKVRAFNPWPGAHIVTGGRLLKVNRARAEPISAPEGSRLVVGGQPALATSNGLLVFEEVQPAGKKTMRGRDYLRGARDWERTGRLDPAPGA